MGDVADLVSTILPDADGLSLADTLTQACGVVNLGRTAEHFQPGDDVHAASHLVAGFSMRMRNSLKEVRAAQYELTAVCSSMAAGYERLEMQQDEIFEVFEERQKWLAKEDQLEKFRERQRALST